MLRCISKNNSNYVKQNEYGRQKNPESSLAKGSMERPYVPERLFSLGPSDNQLATLVSFIVRKIARHTGCLTRDPVFLHLLLALSNQNERTTFETYRKKEYPAISFLNELLRGDLRLGLKPHRGRNATGPIMILFNWDKGRIWRDSHVGSEGGDNLICSMLRAVRMR